MASAVLEKVLAGRPQGPSLDEYAATVDQIAAVERRRDAQLAHARAMLDLSLDAPRQFKTAWQQAIRLPLDTLYQLREPFEGALRAQLDTIELTARILPLAEALAGRPLAGADGLTAARAELTTFADRILAHWTSPDELADIACETFELPEWLRKGPIPPHLQPPQSWWEDEDDDPFKPLPDDVP